MMRRTFNLKGLFDPHSTFIGELRKCPAGSELEILTDSEKYSRTLHQVARMFDLEIVEHSTNKITATYVFYKPLEEE